MELEQLDNYVQKYKLSLFIILFTKLSSRWITDLYIKHKTTKVLKHRRKSLFFWIRQRGFKQGNIMIHKRQIDKLTLIKFFRLFCERHCCCCCC